MKGLGDAIAAFTSAAGIQPCGGCKKRQDFLNRVLPFGGTPDVFNPPHMAEKGLRMLRRRDVNQLQQFHLAQSQNKIFCLDFNRWFDDLDQFDEWVIPAIKALQPGELLPSTPEAIWRQYVDPSRFMIVAFYGLPAEVATSRGVRKVVVCRGEFA